MSKEAGLRAMREARYAQRMARSTTTPAAPAPTRAASRPAKAEAPVAPEPASDALCGHKSMNGRSCTREQGHTAKNHRYS